MTPKMSLLQQQTDTTSIVVNMNTEKVVEYLQMQTGRSPDHVWSCWQIRTDEPMSLNPELHW